MGQRKNKTFKERCEEVYKFIVDFYYNNHFGPTYSEMIDGTGVLRGNLALVIKQLIADGKVERRSNTIRGIWPTLAAYQDSLPLHLSGEIAADNLYPMDIPDQLDVDNTLEVPRYLLPAGASHATCYVLKVVGSSMSKVNILNGDFIVLQIKENYKPEDIVAVLLLDENAVTLKSLLPTKRGNVKLNPKSHEHHPRIEKAENIKVLGHVVAVMRNMTGNFKFGAAQK